MFAVALMDKGIIAKEGSIVDARFVDVPKQRNSKEDNADIKKGAVPLKFGKKIRMVNNPNYAKKIPMQDG